MKTYGYSSIIDVSDCDIKRFTRDMIKEFLTTLCHAIDMEREDLHFWDYQGDMRAYANAESHLRGVSAVQFIKTSSIVIHTLDDFKAVFIDLFSCKEYDPEVVKTLVEIHFKGKVQSCETFKRAF